jgi:hypothetical protein
VFSACGLYKCVGVYQETLLLKINLSSFTNYHNIALSFTCRKKIISHIHLFASVVDTSYKQAIKKNSVALSPQANYTD